MSTHDYIVYIYVGGSIPATLCDLTLLSLNVENNNIDCYDGCLTSAHISITGATSICPDNNKLYLFIEISSSFIFVGIISTIYYSKYVSADIKYKYNYYSAYVSFGKLIIVIFLVLWIDDYWYYCAHESSHIIEACTSVEYNKCNSYCDDVSTTLVTTNDDIGLKHYTTGGYCTASFDGACACKYWQRFMLLPLFMHFLHFVWQAVCFSCFFQLDPQQIHYNIINKYLTMEVKGNMYEWISGLLHELCRQPYYSGFAFIEIVTMVYVWLELWISPVHCGGHIRLSQVYFPLFMTLLDISKYNIYMSFKHIRSKEYIASVTAFFNLYFMWVYFMLTVVLGFVYAYTVSMDGCRYLYYTCVRLFGIRNDPDEDEEESRDMVHEIDYRLNSNNKSGTQPLLSSFSEGIVEDTSMNSIDAKL